MKWAKIPLACAAAHIAAACGTVLLVRSHPRAMWILWMIAGASLIAFYAWWASRAGTMAPVAIGAAGLLCDLTGESMFLVDPQGSRAAALLTGGAANGLYTVAGILLTVATPSLPLRWLAWLVWTSGVTLTLLTILDMRPGIVIASAALMIFFIPFVLSMAWQ